MHNLKELKIRTKSIDVTIDVYKATCNFPKEETYGLTSQTRRSAVSVPSNIVEKALNPLLQKIDELQKMNYSFQNTLKERRI